MVIKKAQLSLEFLLVFSFVLLVFLFLFALISSQRSTGLSQQTFSQLQLVAQNIATQINNALEAGTYSSSVQIINRIGNIPFNITITGNGAVIASAKVGTQVIQAVAYSMARSIISNPSFKQSNGAYLIPLANSTIYIASSNGQVCIDYNCINTTNQASSISLQSQVVHAAEFNGQSSYISSSISSTTISALTACVWVNMATPPSGSVKSYEPFSINSGNGLFELYATNTLFWGGSSSAASNSINLLPGKWYLLCGTYNGAQLTLYINGIAGTSASATGSITFNTIEIGDGANIVTNGNTFQTYFPGIIANAQLYNTSLSPSQIQALYNGGISSLPILPGNLIGWWPLNGNANDYSGNGNNGVIKGPVLFPTVAELFAKVANSVGTALSNVLVGFTTTLGTFGSSGSSFTNYTNSNGIATAFLTQNSTSGQALVKAFAFNGNLSTEKYLVGWWPLGEGQGTTAYDLSGYGNSGNVIDASWGSPNYVASFGGNGYMAATTQFIPMNSISLVFWIYPKAIERYAAGCTSSAENNASVIAYLGSSTSSIEVAYNSSQGIYLGGASNNCGASFANSALIENWTQVAIVQSPSGEYIYINGVLSGTAAASTGSIKNIMLGSSLGSTGNGNLGDYNFQGLISNVQLYNTSLSSTQLQQLYSEGISGVPIFSHLVDWWPLDGNANDYFNSTNNGAMFGDASFVPLQNIPSTNSSSILAGSFNPTGSTSQAAYINVTGYVPLNTLQFSYFAWIYPTSSESYSRILATSGGDKGAIEVSVGGSTQIELNGYNGIGWISVGPVFPLDTWNFVGATYNGTAYNVYLNGQRIWSKTESLSGATSGIFQIGLTTAYGISGNQYFGYISNVQAYNTSLSPQQVQALYKEGVTGLPLRNAGLVGWWPLNGNANDYSGNGKNGTAINVAYAVQQGIIPHLTNSWKNLGIEFSGQNSYINGASPDLPTSMPITITALVNPKSYQNSVYGLGVVAGWGAASAANTIALDIENDGQLYAMDYGGDCAVALKAEPNAWSFVALSVSASKVASFFINGQAASCTMGTLPTPPSQNLGIGGIQSSRYFNGSIADVQIYNTNLNAQQVQQLYQNPVPPSASITIPLGWLP